MLSVKTREYYQNVTLDKRKKFGQFMTPYDIIDQAIQPLDLSHIKNILEPSCGTGQFIDRLIDKEYNGKITGIELDTDIYKIIKKSYKKNKNVDILNDNFLTHKFEETYDLVLGNPPYFEFKPDHILKNEFNDVINGRVNIYMLFIKKSIDLLNPSGILIFVIPTSILSSAYFQKIRNYIVSTCNIIQIKILSTDDFEDAQQQTMIFGLKKLNHNEKQDEKYIVKIGGNIIFNEDYENLNKIIKDKKFICDLKCSVKTGTVVWNQHKDKLLDKPTKSSSILVYPRNLSNGKLVLSEHTNKKQYIEINKESIKDPVIAINRIIGVKEISLNPVLLKDGQYLFENHVNIITGKLKNLEKINKSLGKPETVSFIKSIIGNTQLSKTELETMIPIFD